MREKKKKEAQHELKNLNIVICTLQFFYCYTFVPLNNILHILQHIDTDLTSKYFCL